MMGSVSVYLVVWSVFAPALLIAAHVSLYRLGFRPVEGRSPQAFLARLVAVLNIPVMVVTGLIGWAEARATGETLLMMVFVLVVFNCAAYAYFHVFNMSETARRIRMLLYLYEQGGATAEKLRTAYSPADIITTRLQRLVEMRQVARRANGRYYISGWLLPWAANAIEFIRNLLGFDRS